MGARPNYPNNAILGPRRVLFGVFWVPLTDVIDKGPKPPQTACNGVCLQVKCLSARCGSRSSPS
jgi:hypothetical protein